MAFQRERRFDVANLQPRFDWASQCGPSILPLPRHRKRLHKPRHRHLLRLPPIQDGLNDVRRQQGKPETTTMTKLSDTQRVILSAAAQHRMGLARPPIAMCAGVSARCCARRRSSTSRNGPSDIACSAAAPPQVRRDAANAPLAAMARSCAIEHAPRGISVNVVAPAADRALHQPGRGRGADGLPARPRGWRDHRPADA